MKLKLTMLSLMGAVALNASAQESSKATQVVYEKSPSANWFITFQGGASFMARGNNSVAKFGERLTFTPSLAVGKWFNPYFATRVKVQGGEAYTFAKVAGANFKQSNYFVGGHLDFMFDVVNFLTDHNKKNFFHIIPYVGAGYEFKFGSNMFNNVQVGTATAGIQLACRLSDRVDFVVEGETTYNGMRVSSVSHLEPWENKWRLGASAGLSFRLGKVGHGVVKPMDEALVARLQGDINTLRAENAELAKRPVNCPEVDELAPVVAEASRFLADKSILFKHGKYNVSDDQLITIFDASEFVNKHSGQIIVTGYAQKSESRFAGLAEKRAQAVAKILTEKYGVPTERITVEYKGVDEAPFDAKSAAWNRVVIIRSK